MNEFVWICESPWGLFSLYKINVLKDVIEIAGIGHVYLRMSRKAKRLAIRVSPFRGIEVTVPLGTSPDVLGRFLKQYHEWMQEALGKAKAKEKSLTIFDETTMFKSRTFQLKIEAENRKDVRLVLKSGLLLVRYPSVMDVRTQSIQEIIRHGIEEALRLEAKRFLPERLAVLANQHRFSFKRVTIKNLKSRWGSCSSVDNINLNLHLMRLPDHLVDYVLLHELCHTVEKNHGPGFRKLLRQVTNGKSSECEKEIKNYRTVIY
jgi:hypothetical protein